MKFILTKDLGRLARWLRILGFDTVYYTGDKIGELVIKALGEDRFLLTRAKRRPQALTGKKLVVTSPVLGEQLEEVILKLNLCLDESKMFTRCTICNGRLQKAGKTSVRKSVPPHVYGVQQIFFKCPDCGKVYWQGSHWGNVKAVIKRFL